MGERCASREGVWLSMKKHGIARKE